MAVLRWFFQLFWIGVCALAMLWQTELLLDAPSPGFWLYAFVFSATVFGYNFTAQKARRLPARALGVFAAFCFLELTLLQKLVLALPVLIWLLYYDRYRPGQGTGLRRYPALKPLAIALAWAGVTVLLPLPVYLWPDAALLFVGRAAFIFVLALAYDLCDQPYDLEHGLTTLVMRLGPRNSFRLIDAVLLLAAGCVGLNFGFGRFAAGPSLSLLLSLAIAEIVIRRVVGRLDWVGWRKVFIDGLMVVQFILVWLSLNLDF